jgi:hypothetical protein
MAATRQRDRCSPGEYPQTFSAAVAEIPRFQIVRTKLTGVL